MDYLIRECREADLATLVDLCGKHALHERAPFDPTGKQQKLKTALFSTHPSLFCLIVECKGQVAGYASYTLDFSTWDAARFLHLDCLYIEPEFRKQGIGEAIITKLRSLAADTGCVDIQWQTPVFNTGAIRFYRRIGADEKVKIRFYLKIS
jgi:GNAT superfamily N-acetyltransferase